MTAAGIGGVAPEKIHDLKIWPQYYDAILEGRKSFEYRFDDRGFREGDILHLHEYRPDKKQYTNRVMRVYVTYLLEVEKGWVIMSISPKKPL